MFRRIHAATICLLAFLLLAGCAGTSAGDVPQRLAALDADCPPGTVRQCDAWGGNRFRKRYTDCACVLR